MSETLFRTIQNQSDIDRRTGVLESAEYAIMQVGAAPPAHTAAESVLYFDMTNDDLYVNIDGVNAWLLLAGGGGIVAPHNLLSISHPDTLAGAPVRGNLIVADATPEWAGLVVGGAHQIFKVNAGATDPIWASFDWDEIASAAAADMVHNHTNNTEGGLLTTGSISDLAYAVPNLTLTTVNAAGVANTVIRSDASVLVFDANVPNIIQPDDAAAVGVATVAARRDHEHGIVADAPGANSVNLAASAEGAGTSFSRNDHTHNLDESITPTWTGAHIHSVANVSFYSGADLLIYSDAGVSLTASIDGATGNIVCGVEIFRTVNNSVLVLTGGNAVGAGANIEIYGGAHAAEANDIFYDATVHTFRSQNGATLYAETGSGYLQLGGQSVFRTINNDGLIISGGSAAGNGANIELYGGTHAALANWAIYDADRHILRSQNGATNYLILNGTNDLFELYTTTEAMTIADAGSAGATEQDWIEVTVGGNTGYIHVFAAV